jgi:serine/threonine protein kinase
MKAGGLRLGFRRPDGRLDTVQLVKPLGAGGTATVFEATGEARAVVKLPRHDLFLQHPERAAETKAEVARELQMLLRVASSRTDDSFHLAELLGAGILSDGVPFLVMRYVDGRTLAELIDEAFGDLRSVPSLSMVLGAMLGAARGLRLLHSHGILHRDIKPNNIVVPLGRPELSALVDLGPAKPSTAEIEARSGGDAVPNMNRLYSAPEYVATGRATVATDLYALGITLFEALTGVLPHEQELAQELGRSRLEVTDLQRPGVQMRLATLRARVLPSIPQSEGRPLPAEVTALVQSLLHPDPLQRPHSAHDVATVLEAAVLGVDKSGMFRTATAAPQRPQEAAPAFPPKRRWPQWTYPVSLVAAGAVGATLWLSLSSAPVATPKSGQTLLPAAPVGLPPAQLAADVGASPAVGAATAEKIEAGAPSQPTPPIVGEAERADSAPLGEPGGAFQPEPQHATMTVVTRGDDSAVITLARFDHGGFYADEHFPVGAEASPNMPILAQSTGTLPCRNLRVGEVVAVVVEWRCGTYTTTYRITTLAESLELASPCPDEFAPALASHGSAEPSPPKIGRSSGGAKTGDESKTVAQSRDPSEPVEVLRNRFQGDELP